MTKIILALDYSDKKLAMKLINHLDPSMCYLKVGPIMFIRYGTKFIEELHNLNFKVFLDLKLYDIPNTIFYSVKSIADMGIWMLSLHISGGVNMIKAAKNAIKNYKNSAPLLIGVTVLTSFNRNDLQQVGIYTTIKKQIFLLANLSKKYCLDGIVCPGIECQNIKKKFGKDFKIITPGIRFSQKKIDDQYQITNLDLVKQEKIDFLVIGRLITSTSNPIKILNKIIKNLAR